MARTDRRHLWVAIALLAVDQATKQLAARTLKGMGRLTYLADTLRLQYAENPGAFLSLGASLSPTMRNALFLGGNLVLLGGCAWLLIRDAWTPRQQLGWWLVLSGGVANLIDRVLRGAVIDFLNVGVGPVRTGIFNVADMAIMLGVGLLIIGGRAAERTSDAPSA
jgi:signal peptidase II